MAVKVTVKSLRGFTAKEENVFRLSGMLLEKALNDPDFERRVLEARYTHLSFRPASDKPVVQKKPADIVALIGAGLERGSSKDNELDIAIVKDVDRKRPSVGGSYPGVLPWETAKWFIDLCVDRQKPDTISPARHIIHEWLHVSGFVHQGKKGDPPYVVGSIVRDILKQVRTFDDAHEDAEVARALDESFDDVSEDAAP
ncbi:MAG TPA: hypothetical protein VF559_08470 [Caulobacteraceae bacterium]|jgi:hypothetical protein